VTCRELADFMFDYVHGNLPHDVRMVFEQHLVVCRNCREYLAQYETTIALSRQLAAADRAAATAYGVPEELVAAILQAQRR